MTIEQELEKICKIWGPFDIEFIYLGRHILADWGDSYVIYRTDEEDNLFLNFLKKEQSITLCIL